MLQVCDFGWTVRFVTVRRLGSGTCLLTTPMLRARHSCTPNLASALIETGSRWRLFLARWLAFWAA